MSDDLIPVCFFNLIPVFCLLTTLSFTGQRSQIFKDIVRLMWSQPHGLFDFLVCEFLALFVGLRQPDAFSVSSPHSNT